MRTFILYTNKGRTDHKFSLEDLPSSGGRMDLVARFITSCMFISHKMRQDTRVFVILNGAPKPPVTIEINPSVRKIGVDERSVALWIRKLLEELEDRDSFHMYNGLKATRESFRDIIKRLKKEGTIYVLNEGGVSIKKTKFEKNPIFIIGDHVGVPEKEEKFALRLGKKLSLGKTPYLASTCVSLLHWTIDQK
jgi:tRNA (pseudouridine54-N1)-methyltransferase